jgi:copper chaperone CopZ
MEMMSNMYRFFSVILIFGLMLVSSGCTNPAQNSYVQGIDTDGYEVRIYEVFGMDCPGCHGGLEKLINKIPAVQSSKANWNSKQLSVTVKPDYDLNDEDVYDAIRRGNFTPGKRIK